MNKAKEIRKKLESGQLVIGTHISLSDSSITEMLGLVGFDFIWIDGEHSALDKLDIRNHLIAARAGNSAGIVRVVSNSNSFIKPILDFGPDGIIVPMICTREEAAKFITSCLYPMKGIRSYGPNRSNDYGLILQKDFVSNAEESFLRLIQIEHISAVDNLQQILLTKGIDAIIVGPQDLSASMGFLGDLENKQLNETFDYIVHTAKVAKIPVGVSCDNNMERIMKWAQRGIDLISVEMDYGFIISSAKNLYDRLKHL